MAEEEFSTPSTSSESRENHTRPHEPASGHGAHLRTSKRRKDHADTCVPIRLNLGGGADDTPSPEAATATSAITSQLDAIRKEAEKHRNMITVLAQAVDKCMDSFTGPDERAAAGALRQHVIRGLMVYTATIGSPAPSAPFSTSAPSVELPFTSESDRSEASGSTWASIVSKPQAPQPSIAKEKTRGTTAHITKRTDTAKASTKEDLRILITLTTTARLQPHIPYAARQAIASAVEGITLVDIPKATRTRTGWAIFPANLEVRNRPMDPESREKMIQAVGGTNAALPETWHNYAVPRVADTYQNLNGILTHTTLQMVEEEAALQTGKRPVSCRPSRHGPSDHGRRTWVISFKEPVRHFQLFGTSNRSFKIEKKPQVQRHNPGCQGYCNPAQCARGARCGNCGGLVAEHRGPVGENCTHPEQCANCYGPHRPGHEMCPAAPRREKGRLIRPTKKELTALRRTGKRAYDAKQKEKDHQNQSTSAEAQATEVADLTATQTPNTDATPPTNSPEMHTNTLPECNQDVPATTLTQNQRPKRTETGSKNLNVKKLLRATSGWGTHEHSPSSTSSSTDKEDTTMEDDPTIC